jgi:hypothetical protein
MKVVKIRSPFIIEVNQSGQVGSKVELSIWNGSSYPTSGTGFYSLSKAIPSATQISTYYNVSNYVKEFIDNIKATYTNYVGSIEQNNEWTRFQIKRYWYNGTVYTVLDTTEYVGVNGFSNYIDGYQNPTDINMILLGNENINNYYYSQTTYPTNTIQYFNLLIDKPTLTTTTINVKFERIDGIVKVVTIAFAVGSAGIINATIPISIIKVDSDYINGCKVTITYTPVTGSPIVQSFYTYPIEECKYTPVLCDFVNRYGGWQTITFFKAQTNAVSVKGSEYNLLPDAIDYNIYKGQSKVFNINGTQTVKLNTGWVDENYNELITDLLLSETVLLDNKPVKVKTQSHTYKTQLKDKMINFEIDFEYAFDLINDVV